MIFLLNKLLLLLDSGGHFSPVRPPNGQLTDALHSPLPWRQELRFHDNLYKMGTGRPRRIIQYLCEHVLPQMQVMLPVSRFSITHVALRTQF